MQIFRRKGGKKEGKIDFLYNSLGRFLSFLFFSFSQSYNRAIFNLIPPQLPLNDRFSPCPDVELIKKVQGNFQYFFRPKFPPRGRETIGSNFPPVKLYLFHGQYSFTTYFPCLRYYVFLGFLSRSRKKRSPKKKQICLSFI